MTLIAVGASPPPRPDGLPDDEDDPPAGWRARSPGLILVNLLIGLAIGFCLSIANVILITILGRDLDSGGERAETAGATASAMLWLVGIVAWMLAAYLERPAKLRWSLFTAVVAGALAAATVVTGSFMAAPR